MKGRSYSELLESAANEIMPALCELAGGERNAAKLFGMFVLGAAVSDGTLDEREYGLLEHTFYTFFGDEVSYANSKVLVDGMVARGNGLKSITDELIDFLGAADTRLKERLVSVCLMICAVDGVVSPAEQAWIKQLIA